MTETVSVQAHGAPEELDELLLLSSLPLLLLLSLPLLPLESLGAPLLLDEEDDEDESLLPLDDELLLDGGSSLELEESPLPLDDELMELPLLSLDPLEELSLDPLELLLLEDTHGMSHNSGQTVHRVRTTPPALIRRQTFGRQLPQSCPRFGAQTGRPMP